MYITTNPPVIHQISWGGSVNYVNWQPNYHNNNIKFTSDDFLKSNMINLKFDEEFIAKISNIFSKLYNRLQMSQQTFNDDYDEREAIRIKIPKLDKYNKNRNLIIRTHLQQFIILIKEQEKQKGLELQMIKTILTYLYQVNTKQPDVYFNPPRVQMIYKWLMNRLCITSTSTTDNPAKRLIEIFRQGNLENVLNTIDNIILQSKLPPEENVMYLQIMDLIYSKMKLFNCGKSLGREKLQHKDLVQFTYHFEDAAVNKFKQYHSKFPKSEGVKILEVLSGSFDAIEAMANKNWKIYIMLCIAYSPTVMLPSQIFNNLRQFIAKYKIQLSKIEKLELLLLHNDFYQPFKYASQFIPEPIISTIAIFAYELRQFNDSIFIQLNGTSHIESIYVELTNWISDTNVPWETKYPYLQQFIKTFKNKQQAYIDVVDRILQQVEIYTPIKTKQQYAKVLSYCRSVQNLKLTHRRQFYYLKNLILHQVRCNSFQYLFQLIYIYQDKSKDETLLKEVFEGSILLMESKELDYKSLVQTILSLQRSRFSDLFKEKVVQIFYPICIFYEAVSIEQIQKSREIIIYLLESQYKNQMYGFVIEALIQLVKTHGPQFLLPIYDKIKTISYDIGTKKPQILEKNKQNLTILGQLVQF